MHVQKAVRVCARGARRRGDSVRGSGSGRSAKRVRPSRRNSRPNRADREGPERADQAGVHRNSAVDVVDYSKVCTESKSRSIERLWTTWASTPRRRNVKPARRLAAFGVNLMLRDLNLPASRRERGAADYHARRKPRTIHISRLPGGRPGRLPRRSRPTMGGLRAAYRSDRKLDRAGGSHDGPTGRISGGTFGAAKVLVVTEPYEVHRHIAKLLEEIRELSRQNPSEEPPLRSRHGMGRNVPGMMGPGTQTPGMAAPRVKTQMKTDKQSGTVMPGTRLAWACPA